MRINITHKSCENFCFIIIYYCAFIYIYIYLLVIKIKLKLVENSKHRKTFFTLLSVQVSQILKYKPLKYNIIKCNCMFFYFFTLYHNIYYVGM